METLNFLDIGARKGRTAALVLKDPRPNIRVYMFEPNPSLAERLRERFKDDERAEVFEWAVAGHNKKDTLYIPDETSESSSLYSIKKTSVGAPTIQVQCVDIASVFGMIEDGPVVLYSNCEGSEFDFVPKILDTNMKDRIKFWSVSFHHGDRKIPEMKPAYWKIEERLKELGIENIQGHFGKGDIKAGKLQKFVDQVLKLVP